MANVTTILKKRFMGKPVSLISVLVKIVETAVKDKISKHLEMQALLKLTQLGLTKGRFCLTNLLVFRVLIKHIDKGKLVDLVYLDSEKKKKKRLIKSLTKERQ